MGLKSFTGYDVFKRNADFFGNRVAVVFEEREITFGKLQAMADRIVRPQGKKVQWHNVR